MLKARLLCVVAMALYAGNALTGRAINEMPPFTIASTRFLVAFLVLLPLGWAEARRARDVFWRNPGPVLLLSVSGMALFNALLYIALQVTTATNVAVLQSAVPAVTALLSWLVLRQVLGPSQWVGILTAFVGAAWVVTGGDPLSSLAWERWNAGDVTVLVASVSWAWYSIAVRRYSPRFPPIGLLLVMTGVAFVLVLPFTVGEWVVGGVPPLAPSPSWWGLLYVGVFPSVVAMLLYNRAVAELGAPQAAVFLCLLPVFTMLGAAGFLGEHVGTAHMLGASLVIAGVGLTTRPAGGATVGSGSSDRSRQEGGVDRH
jgi:drug/metabolite transporter (DMT)-like permease